MLADDPILRVVDVIAELALGVASVLTALRNFSGSATRQTMYVLTMIGTLPRVVVSANCAASSTLMRESNLWTCSMGVGHLKYRPGLVTSRTGLPNRVTKPDSVSRTWNVTR